MSLQQYGYTPRGNKIFQSKAEVDEYLDDHGTVSLIKIEGLEGIYVADDNNTVHGSLGTGLTKRYAGTKFEIKSSAIIEKSSDLGLDTPLD